MKGYTPLCIRVPKSQSLKIDREQLEPEPEPLPFLSPVPADPTMPTSLSAVTTCMPSLTEPPRQEMGPLTWPQMPVPQLQLSLPTEAPPLAHSSFLTESAPLLQTSPPSLPQMSTPLQLNSQTSVTVYTIPSGRTTSKELVLMCVLRWFQSACSFSSERQWQFCSYADQLSASFRHSISDRFDNASSVSTSCALPIVLSFDVCVLLCSRNHR